MSEAVSSTSEVKTAEMLKESQEALDLLAQGKRNLLCGDMLQAINQLQSACRKLGVIHGEGADACGEAYFTYGKALLEMGRMESGVLGNALQGISDDEEAAEEESESGESKEEEEKLSAKEKEDISDKVIEAMEETDEEMKSRVVKEKNGDVKENTDDKENSDKGNGVEDKENGKDEVKEEEIKDNGEAKKEEEETMETDESAEKKKEESAVESEDIGEESQEESQEEEEKSQEEGEKSQEEGEKSQEEGEKSQDDDNKTVDDDISNLQLSWEMLELAKSIFKKKEDKKEDKVKLADIYLCLGEVGLESEQYDQSVGDFQECLKIQKECFEESDRALAETCYQLGLTYSFKADYEDSIKYYKEAASIMEAVIVKLEAVVAEGEKSGKGKDVASVDDPVVRAQKEITELKEIIPDIMSKIEDVLDEQKSGETAKKMLKENLAARIGGSSEVAVSTSSTTTKGASDFEGASTASSDAVVSDISHLVRKKRKTECEEEEDAKKPKVEQNGDAPTNGHSKEGNAKAEDVKTKTVEDVNMAEDVKVAAESTTSA